MNGRAMLVVPVLAEAAATALGAHPDYRVLRRLDRMERRMRLTSRDALLAGCAIDVETTGLDHRGDAVIELALQRFWADAEGRIVITGRMHDWLEDPGRPIDPVVTRLTGLSDADVAGRRILDPVAASLIADADFVVAHNAGFDRPFVEARLPFCAGGAWVCSMRDVDWAGLGFEGRSLGHLLMQMGWFYPAHRAHVDVTALLHLLDHRLPCGRTVLRHAVDAASAPGWSVEAVGAPFEAKNLLKARGYRWNATDKLWSREVGSADVDAEAEWAGVGVYGGLAKPRLRKVTWRERYAIGS